MNEESVARRYAAALFAQAKETGLLRLVRDDLDSVAQAYKQVRALRTILDEPFITQERKKGALNAAFGGKISASTLSFLNLLTDKRRLDIIPEVSEEFRRLVRASDNIALATAQTAVPLSPADTERLQQSLEARTGLKLELKTSVDPSLIGGVLVRIGDTVYDGSVRGNLERLREQLLMRK